METVTIREWQELPIGTDGVAEPASHRLLRLAERETRRLRVPQPILSRTAQQGLRAGQVVGVLTVPGARLEILPKIDGKEERVRHSLTRMLAVALRLPIADSEPSPMATQRRDMLGSSCSSSRIGYLPPRDAASRTATDRMTTICRCSGGSWTSVGSLLRIPHGLIFSPAPTQNCPSIRL